MSKHLNPLAAALLAVSLMPATASAATATYHMQILEPTLKVGTAVPVTVRIIDDASGKPVTTASITQQKLQMLMSTMVMPGTVTPLPHTDSEDYRFTADLSMPGEWQLDLIARIPDQAKETTASLRFQAVR
jgi:hypothetical protein